MAPTNPKNITAKFSNGSTEDYVIFTNLTRGGKVVVQSVVGTGTTADASITDQSANSWATGDIINATLQGRLKGSAQGTITKSGGIVLNITDSADTNSVAVDL